jgi:hypothetical protein
VAVRIERVEREFILVSAAESRTEARLRAAGRSIKCTVAAAGGESVSFSSAPSIGGQAVPAPAFALRELVSVRFDFRGQSVAFDAPVIKSSPIGIELRFPETMYRSLSRRWTRVKPPKDLIVDFILADSSLSLDCPESDEWVEVELPELRAGLDSSTLTSLVDSFKDKAKCIASEGRVVMYKSQGPADIAEEMAARVGRVLYVPSTRGLLPQVDPYSAGRIITRDMAEDFEGPLAAVQGTKLAAYLRERAGGGLNSAIWCPVIYYHYAVGMVYIANGPERPIALDFGAVDLAWEFSRILAWFLKRHGYFAESTASGSAPKRGSIVDASPSGLLAVLPIGGPKIEQGSTIRLRLGLKEKVIVCTGRVARRYNEAGMSFCGIAFVDLSAQDMAALSIGLYGDEDQSADDRGA